MTRDTERLRILDRLGAAFGERNHVIANRREHIAIRVQTLDTPWMFREELFAGVLESRAVQAFRRLMLRPDGTALVHVATRHPADMTRTLRSGRHTYTLG